VDLTRDDVAMIGVAQRERGLIRAAMSVQQLKRAYETVPVAAALSGFVCGAVENDATSLLNPLPLALCATPVVIPLCSHYCSFLC
jgi:hypothetical protein